MWKSMNTMSKWKMEILIGLYLESCWRFQDLQRSPSIMLDGEHLVSRTFFFLQYKNQVAFLLAFLTKKILLFIAAPEDYVDYFHENNVTAVVRLNKKMYEACQFEDNGVKHYDMYFPDGTCPTEEIMQEFLRLVDAERGALAVHCKAGLGRTGVLICCYMIRNYGFTAEEAMGYIRVCRPGSVLGPQQNYLLQHAPRLLYEGRVHRASMKLQACKLPSSRPCSMEVNQSSEDSNRLNNKRGSVIHITARSSSVDMVDATMHNGVTVQQQEVRRSPRLNKGAVEEAPVESNNRMHLSMGGARSPVLSPFEGNY